MRRRWEISLLFLWALGCASNSLYDQTIYFCRPKVSQILVDGRASFSVIYRFQVDQDGRPVSIETLREIAGVESMAGCLAQWRLPGFPEKTDVLAVLRWEHARGWIELRIVSPDGEEKVVLVEEDVPPYCSESS